MPAHELTSGLTPAVWVHRGQGVEAVHSAAIAVVDGSSRLTHALGDPELCFFSRSSIKPFQALPLVESGGLARFELGAEQLALCAASHNGTDRHRAVAEGMLQRLGLTASALQCGTHLPFALSLAGTYPSHGEDLDPLRHNCSGKHCGFLAQALLRQQPIETYLDPNGAVQQQVRHAVAEACELDAASLLVGTDGCSAPNFALPLVNLARGFKNLAAGASTSLARVRDAMLEHPLLVSGEGRLDYDLSVAFPGRVVVKGGAEAMLLCAFSEPALGFAIKVIDGASRALGPLVVETLKQLALIDDLERFPSLQRHAAPALTNYRKLEVGKIQADFRLAAL
jgi:L-asparaginase II